MTRVPREIETRFRKELGNVTPYMSVVDIATREFINSHDISQIQHIAKIQGHSRLAVGHLNLNNAQIFVYISQMAFINSRADRFCDEVREFQKELTNDKSSPNLDGLDKLRKTIYKVVSSKSNDGEPPDKMDQAMYEEYAGAVELKIVDYYRGIRNTEFHGGNDGCDTKLPFSTEELCKINDAYKYTPKIFANLTSRDVILYSQAWQNIAVSLCGKLVDIKEVIRKLCLKYSTHLPTRRENAITSTLKQDYLQGGLKIEVQHPYLF